ncbi:MAG: hypothetical protein L6R42_003443, partial [Xanthoria sp. 1 TBL-2021]
TTTTSIVEQREIYRAILAIQKQSQGNSSSRAKRFSMGGSSEGTPRVVSPPSLASHTNSKKTSSHGDEMTSIAPSLADLPSPQAFMAKSDPPVLRNSEFEATNKNPSSGSIDTIDEAQRDGMNSNSNRLSPGGDKTPELTATVGSQREQRKVLDYFVTKPIIKDDTRWPGGISLSFRNHKIPMQQVDIRKKLFCSKEEGLQPVLDAYLELCDHERHIFDDLTEDIKSHTSLMLLKRTYADISYGGILFKGVPELQFIMERPMNENQNKSGDEAISETTSKARYKAMREVARREAREVTPKAAREAAPRAAYEAEIEAARRAEIEAVLEAAREAARREALAATTKAECEAAPRAAYEAEIEAELEAAREAVSFHHRSPPPPKSGEHDSDEERGPQIRHHGAPPPLWDVSRHTLADRTIVRCGRQLELGDIISGSFLPHQGSENSAELKRKEDVVEPEDALGEAKQSDDSDESSIMSDDAMNDEEAEKVVKELLEKYTTLGAVVGQVSGSG